MQEILFNSSNDKDYYKPIRTNSAFNNNFIEYESKGDKDKILSVKEYLYMIVPYLSDIINDHKNHSSNKVIDYQTQGEWKIQLSMRIYFMSFRDSDEIRDVHTASNNIEIMIGNKKSEIVEELFKSLLQKYQQQVEESIRGSEFVFDSVD